MKAWNKKALQQRVNENKLRGFVVPEQKKKQIPKVPKVTPHSKGLEYIKWNLWYWCNQQAVEMSHEYQFDEKRQFRFDFAIVSLKIAVEFEGGVHTQNSGHNNARHYTKDTEKYNLAARLGWTVLRFTALNYQTLLKELNACLTK
jgi:very-short-patch-repair endonuclease